MRRVLFSVLVVVVGCMGGWFLLTTVVGGADGRRVLSVTDETPRGSACYTVQLLPEFAPSRSKRAIAERMIGREPLAELAGEHEFYILEFPNGRAALCAGRFRDRQAPEMAELLRRLRTYSEDGQRLFAEARIRSFSE
jgi:hypothetical protein